MKPIIKCIAAFLGFSCLAMFCSPRAWTRFFSEGTPPFDGNIYYLIAQSGYSIALTDPSLQGLPAFYPMWPMALRTLWQMTGTTGSTVMAGVFAVSLFLFAIAGFITFARRLTPAGPIMPVAYLFVFNPNSVFHATLYSESWFSLAAIAFLFFLWKTQQTFSKVDLLGLTISSSIMSLSRPILLQCVAAGVATLAASWLIRTKPRSVEDTPSFFWSIFAVISGALIGYVPFGLYNQSVFGDFVYPFRLQSLWGREFGLHWSLLFDPKTVSGAWTVLFWDLVAFYLPFILVLIAIFGKRTEFTKRSLAFWFCSFFAMAHSIIAFLTYDRFMSLGRHNLSAPFLYVALLCVLPNHARTRKWVVAGAIVALAFFFNFWARYGRGAWIG